MVTTQILKQEMTLFPVGLKADIVVNIAKKSKIKIEIKMLQTVNVQHNNFTVSHNSITNI